MSLPWLFLIALVAITAVIGLTATWARAAGRVSVMDVAWGLGFVAVAVSTGLLGDGDLVRRGALAALVLIWGARLAWHIFARSGREGHVEDPRYAKILGDGGFPAMVRKVFVPQGLAMLVVSLPLVVGAGLDVAWWPVVWIGIAVWAIGFVFETVGDAQLAAYKAKPRSARPPVLDTGLWAWTRHPNYFGDAAVAWGFWLIGGLGSGWLPGLLTVIAPIAMTHFVRNVTGAKLLERTMSQRPGWDAYAARVPLFFPRPPRRAAG
ncbi:MAG: DUF1295 domain-containing protein [Nocardioides sp.]|jgi:steroid 5-alpha reductase family enzyme